MEENKHVGSSPSLTTQLFGSKHTSFSSTTGIFASIFSPSSKVLGRDSLLSQTKEGEKDFVNEQWIPNSDEDQDDTGNQRQKESQELKNKDLSSFYQEHRAQPCQFTSSIYYGGQDVYARPQAFDSSGVNSAVFKKDWGEDDSGSASRGNWWQGMERRVSLLLAQDHFPRFIYFIKVHRIIDLQYYYNFTSYSMKLDDSEIVVRKSWLIHFPAKHNRISFS